MRLLILAFLLWLSGSAFAQTACERKSTLFQFDQHMKPRVFTEKLGNHPQFPFLQYEKGITTRALFIKAAKDPESRKNYKKEFSVFDELLKETGFKRGYKDLKPANVENLFINPGTIGNLGFFNKESGYIYVKLNPAGESEDGVGAWKITGPTGCSFYVLHTCGNAFFANDPNQGGPGCCRDITFKAQTDTIQTSGTPRRRPLHIQIHFYQAMLVKGKKQEYDTVVRLMRSIDTLTMIKDSTAKPSKIYGKEEIDQQVLCKDTVFYLKLQLTADSLSRPDTLNYVMNDTSWIKRFENNKKDECHKKWEVAVDGGASFNSIPRFDNTTEHTRTNGAQIAAELAISRIFNHWFQAGISASYISLTYQDDIAYAGSAPNTYNTVYVGKPMIPVQVFGKATIGGPLGWQSNISLSAGYSFVRGDKIVNSGNTLDTKPGTKGGLTAGFKMGVAYFFTCKFGVAGSFDGQYFNNKAASMNYHLFALPITLGLRFRF